ncbi:MAG: hypothetical protein HKN47_20330 [Pirellulaceae bacterium]|nr:hypothetical protein [Pirellulaceae bacterium]
MIRLPSLLTVVLLTIVVITVGADGASNAADHVWIAPAKPTAAEGTWYPKAIEQLRGKVILLDAKQLRFQVDGDEAETLIAAYRVLWITSDDLSDKETLALKLFASGQYQQSLRPFIDSLADRPPVWRQQSNSMMAAMAAWRSNQAALALELVSQLDSRPLAPLTIAWLPVDWNGGKSSPSLVDAAKAELDNPSAAVRLVASSWLISSPARTQARQTLGRLAIDNQRPIVARLAEILSWRMVPPPEVGDALPTWQAKIDALPLVLQTGPIRSVIRNCQSAGLPDKVKRLELSIELNPVVPHLP